MRKPLQIKGISTSSAYEDGECLDMLNVRHEQGVLKPVENYPTDFTLKNVYSLLYWHKNNNYTNLIGARRNDLTYPYRGNYKHNAVYFKNNVVVNEGIYYKYINEQSAIRTFLTETSYWEIITSTDHEIQGDLFIVHVSDYNKICWIQNEGEETETEVDLLVDIVSSKVVLSHIGNIINVLYGDVLKYIFWKDTEYLVLNTDFDGKQTDTTLFPVKIDLKVDGENTGGIRNVRAYYGSTLTPALIDVEATKKEIEGLAAHALSKNQSDGLLHGFMYACVAVKLYDGSHIMCSQPVLLGQPYDESTRYTYLNIGTKGPFDYLENNNIVFGMWGHLSGTKNELDKYYSYTQNTANCVPKNGYGLNEDVINISFPNMFGFCSRPFLDSDHDHQNYVCISGNEMKFKVNTNIEEKYRPLISSIDVFMTRNINPLDFTTQKDTLALKSKLPLIDLGQSTDWKDAYNFFPKHKTDKELIAELEDNQIFYKIHEIPFEDIKTTAENDGWVTIDLKGKLGDNLLTQESLILPSFSNIKAENQMTYNSMLHAWDINSVVGRGYPVNYFYPNQGIGQFSGVEGIGEVYTQGWIEYVTVKIKTETGISEVIRITPELQGEYLKMFNLAPILSYPDVRATEISFYRGYYNPDFSNYKEQKKTFKLTASVSQNSAYYISPDLKPISCNNFTGVTDAAIVIPTESNQQLSYQNKLKVSNVNNPFLFPDGQTYQVGDGKILNVGSQSIRTSDGQFGQYPLICFCTDGIFSLEVGNGTVAYSTAVKPQSYERPISKVICTTPFGIVFVSNRGLCMVAGQEVVYFSENMFEKFRDINLELPQAIETIFDLDLSSFNDYLAACTSMVYNPKEQEIIIINPAKPYNYIYNFSTKQFYKNSESIENEINNSLPSLQVWNGSTVKNVTSVEPGLRSVSFVTRPIKMQTTDFKKFERIILRGYLSNPQNATACVWGSLDDKNFKLLRGITLTNSTTRKDLDFGMFGKTTYRSYIVGLSMSLATDSEIEVFELEIEKLYNSTKMR